MRSELDLFLLVACSDTSLLAGQTKIEKGEVVRCAERKGYVIKRGLDSDPDLL